MAITGSGAPFQRGKTFYGGRTIDTSNYEGIQLEGQTVIFAAMKAPDGSPVQPQYDGGDVEAVIVRNVSGVALAPKQLVSFSASSNGRVDGYTDITAEAVAGVVDPRLPAAGVPNGDLFYLIVRDKNCLVKTPIVGWTGDIAIGAVVYAQTAAASTGTTAGRVLGWNTAGTFANATANVTDGTLFNLLLNNIGRAKSARTTGETSADLLIDLQIKR